MRHAAGTVNDDAQVLLETLHGAGDGLTEFETARTGGRRILHDVDAQGNDGEGPLRGLAAGDRQRHGKTMIHRHFIRDGHVELIQDEGLGQMPGERRMSLHNGHRTRSKSFVGDGKAIRHTDEKRGDELQRKGACMVVVDHDGNIGLELREPLARRLVALEKTFPIGRRRRAPIHRNADGRHVRASDAGDDASHGNCPVRHHPCSGCPRRSGRRPASSARSPPWTRPTSSKPHPEMSGHRRRRS